MLGSVNLREMQIYIPLTLKNWKYTLSLGGGVLVPSKLGGGLPFLGGCKNITATLPEESVFDIRIRVVSLGPCSHLL